MSSLSIAIAGRKFVISSSNAIAIFLECTYFSARVMRRYQKMQPVAVTFQFLDVMIAQFFLALKSSRASTNLLQIGDVVDETTSSSDDEHSSSEIIDIQEINRSVSLQSISSTQGISGLLESSSTHKLMIPQQFSKKVKQIEQDRFNFTREELLQRLQNLVKLSDELSSNNLEVKLLKFSMKFT